MPEIPDSPTTGESTTGFSLAYQLGSPSPETIPYQLQDQWIEQINRRHRQIEEEAWKDPRQAIIDALGLPSAPSVFSEGDSPRAAALLSIAQMTAGSDSSASRKAAEELRTVLEDMSLVHQANLTIKLGEVYLRLGDLESAREAIKDGLKIAESCMLVTLTWLTLISSSS